jgi:hypothetical protein
MFFGVFDLLFASGPDVSSVQGGLTPRPLECLGLYNHKWEKVEQFGWGC